MTDSSRTFLIAQTWDGRPLPEGKQATVMLSRDEDGLVVLVDAPFHDDPPPPGPAGATDGLWNHEVVELFIAQAPSGDGPWRYTEIELSPHGHFLVLKLEGVRNVVERGLPLDFTAAISEERWQGRARLPRALLPPPPHLVNAFALHGHGPGRRFLVHAPLPCHLRGSAPDFHRPEGFVNLEL